MKVRSLVLTPLAAAAMLCAGAANAAPRVTNGLNSALSGSGSSSVLNLDVTLGSTMNSLSGSGGMGALPALAPGNGNNRNGDSALNPFAQGSFLHRNPAGYMVFDAANAVRRAAPNGLIPVNSQRPDLPGLRKDATSRLVHDLKLYETTEGALDALDLGNASNMNLPVAGAKPALKRPIAEVSRGKDDDDNGFLGVNNSSTLGTDDGSDNDGGFLGAGDSSTLGTD